MKFIYLDESGTSPRQTTAVVAAIIVDADTQWKKAASALDDLKRLHAPNEEPYNFVFHCVDIMRGHRPFDDPDLWPIEKRRRVVVDLIRTGRELHLPVVLSWFSTTDTHEDLKFEKGVLRRHQFRHIMAFAKALSLADDYVDEFFSDDIATVIAENNSETDRFIKKVPGMLASLKNDKILKPLRHVVHDIQTHRKKNAPCLQFADAAAYGWQSYLNGYDSGDLFVQALYGPHTVRISRDQRASRNGFMLLAPISGTLGG